MSFLKKLFGSKEQAPKVNPVWEKYLQNKNPENLKYFSDMLLENRSLRGSDLTRRISIPIFMMLDGKGVLVRGKEKELMEKVDIAVAVYVKSKYPSLDDQTNFKNFVEEFSSTVTKL